MAEPAASSSTATPPRLIARPSGPLRGTVRAPGDKSISHRALILGALASGVTGIEGILEGDDVLRTAEAVRAFGAGVTRTGAGRWRVEGLGGLSAPEAVIDCGNSGTGARLLMGAAAGYNLFATLDGDASLRRRPMGRVTAPLREMGARFETSAGERLPLKVKGGGLQGFDYRLPVASAQVKSAVLLAALNAAGPTRIIEPEPTRDHTERMLRAFGAAISVEETSEGRRITLEPSQLRGRSVVVPGDPSSAAFALCAALVVPGSEATVGGVLLNPLRTGLFVTLAEMGANLTIEVRTSGAEQVGDVTARYSNLTGVTVPRERAASMIDEYPVLAAVAAFAEGPTVMRGIGELRVKESDRIALMAAGLEACGVEVEQEPDGLIIHGRGRPPAGGADVATAGDHRIAMSHLVLGLGAASPVTVDQATMIATSFPGFVALMRSLGADIGTA